MEQNTTKPLNKKWWVSSVLVFLSSLVFISCGDDQNTAQKLAEQKADDERKAFVSAEQDTILHALQYIKIDSCLFKYVKSRGCYVRFFKISNLTGHYSASDLVFETVFYDKSKNIITTRADTILYHCHFSDTLIQIDKVCWGISPMKNSKMDLPCYNSDVPAHTADAKFSLIGCKLHPKKNFGKLSAPIELHWGESVAEVKKSLVVKGVDTFRIHQDRKDYIHVMNFPFGGRTVDMLELHFGEDSLNALSLIFESSHNLVYKRLYDLYCKLRDEVSSKYGIPIQDAKEFDYPYTEGDDREITALEMDKAKVESWWEFEDGNSIWLSVNSDLKIWLSYENISMFNRSHAKSKVYNLKDY